MKKIKIIAIISALACLSAIFGCGIEKDRYSFGGDGTVQITGDADIKIDGEPLYGIEEYRIIRSDLASETEKTAMMALKNAVKSKLDLDITPSTDFIGGGQEEHEKEIIVGKTNRAESIEAAKDLAFGDFVIKKAGQKVVIVGGSDNATRKAVDFFIAHCIDVYGGCLNIPRDSGYIYRHEYMFDSLTVDGTDISEYSLYAMPGVDISGVSDYIAENVYGVLLPVAETMESSKKYIIFENTGLIANGFSVELRQGDNLYVTGSVKTAEYAVNYFKKDFFQRLAQRSSDCNITFGDNYAGNTEESYTFQSREEIIGKLSEYSSLSTGFLAGEQGSSNADPAYISEIFKTAVGKSPDVLSIDLFSLGLHIDELSDVELSHIVCQLADYASAGGIISVSAYFENPTGGWKHGDKTTGSLSSIENWILLVTNGTELNTKFLRQLDRAADFLKTLGDNGITVVFKPFEGMNSDKYWYSASGKGANATMQAALWRYVRDYITGKGADKLIWQYTPYITDGAKGLFDAYPGDEYVDIIGGVWTEVGAKGISAEYAQGIALRGKPAGPLTVTVSQKKISSGKEGQLALFNCRDLANTVLAAKQSGTPIPAIVTFGLSSSPSWLGEGTALCK